MQKMRLTISALFILVLTFAQMNVQAQQPPTQKDIPVSKQKLLSIKTIEEISSDTSKSWVVINYSISFYGNGIAFGEQDFKGDSVTQKLTDTFRKMPVGTRMLINWTNKNKRDASNFTYNLMSPIPYVITE